MTISLSVIRLIQKNDNSLNNDILKLNSHTVPCAHGLLHGGEYGMYLQLQYIYCKAVFSLMKLFCFGCLLLRTAVLSLFHLLFGTGNIIFSYIWEGVHNTLFYVCKMEYISILLTHCFMHMKWRLIH